MKIITSLLIIASISVAQAEVRQIYKCPGQVEGKFTYQEKPCKGAKSDEHTMKILPADEKKIAEAQAKLAKEVETAEKQPLTETPAESSSSATTAEPTESTPANENTSSANAKTIEPSMPNNSGTTRPAPVIVNPKPKQNANQPAKPQPSGVPLNTKQKNAGSLGL